MDEETRTTNMEIRGINQSYRDEKRERAELHNYFD